jgi:ribonuclease HII
LKTRSNILKEIESMNSKDALEYLLDVQKSNDSKYVNELIKKYKTLLEKDKSEEKRLFDMAIYERKARQQGFKYIGGVDEAGRGPLAGPVVAACVVLPEDAYIEGINDSKQLSEKKREELFDVIRDIAVSWGVGIVDHKTIDDINILNATKLAMEKAVKSLSLEPDILLVDAVKIDSLKIRQVPIVKGDSRSISIAAASIIAKVTRDRILVEMSSHYPVYGFSKHKGYGTREHLEAIKKYGTCPIHRMSYIKKISGG